MLEKLKLVAMLAISFFYFSIFYDINYYLIKSMFYFLKNKV